MAELQAYQERMVTEFKHLGERLDKLNEVLYKREMGTLPYELTDIQVSIMRKQRLAMRLYAECLEELLQIEGITWEAGE